MSTILVVDDNLVSLKLVRLLLSRSGHRLLEAEDSRGALWLLRNQPVDLVLLDVHLPGEMDGLALTRYLKADTQMRHIPIVALTALAMPEDMVRIRAAGCDGYIAKPLRTHVFHEEVERRLIRTPH